MVRFIKVSALCLMTNCTEDILHFENYLKGQRNKIENSIVWLCKPLERFEVCIEISKGVAIEMPKKERLQKIIAFDCPKSNECKSKCSFLLKNI